MDAPFRFMKIEHMCAESMQGGVVHAKGTVMASV